jgi:hypothetical protein
MLGDPEHLVPPLPHAARVARLEVQTVAISLAHT